MPQYFPEVDPDTGDFLSPLVQDAIDARAAAAGSVGHNHDDRYYTETEADGRFIQDSDPRLTDARTPTGHSHPISGVTGLQTALDGKQAAGSYAPASHTHDDRYYTETEADGRFVRTVNGTAPDGAGNVTVATGGTASAAIERTAAGSVRMSQRLIGNLWWVVDLAEFTFSTRGNFPLYQLYSSYVVDRSPYPTYTQDWVDDPAASLTGTWPGGSNAGTYGGTFKYTVTAGAYAEWTSPATTSVWVRIPKLSNGGYASVSIDGSLTAANKLPTAQEVVESGLLAASALTTGGGSIAPTTRLLDCYANPSNWDAITQLADGLTNAAHLVRVSYLGVKRAASADTRIYSSGYGWSVPTGSTSISDKVIGTISPATVFSAWEHAFNVKPVGGPNPHVWIGNTHGYERAISLKFYVDGKEVTPTLGNRLTGDEVSAKRVTDLVHPDHGGGTTPIANVLTTYRMGAHGLEVAWRRDLLIALNIVGDYAAMFPVDESLSRGILPSIAGSIPLTAGHDGAAEDKRAQDNTVTLYQPGGNMVATVTVPDVKGSLDDWVRGAGGQTWIQDRAGNLINKVYMHRVAGSGAYDASIGDVIQSRAVYVVKWAPSADTAAGR